jgi:hypothetical protein
MLKWLGEQFLRVVQGNLDARMQQTGKAVVEEAQRIVPVDTGFLRSTLGYQYNQSTKTLRVYADAYYAFWVHEGTRRMAGRPFLQQALDAIVSKIWGVNLELGFGGPGGTVMPTHLSRRSRGRGRRGPGANSRRTRIYG